MATYTINIEEGNFINFDVPVAITGDFVSFTVNFNKTIPNGITVNWGDGTVENFLAGIINPALTHIYNSPYTGNINISYIGELSDVVAFLESSASNNDFRLNDNISYFSQFTNLETINISRTNITGDISTIPNSVINFLVTSSNTLFGDISSMNPNNTAFRVRGSNTISGNLTNIFNNTFAFEITGNNTVNGDIDNIAINVPASNVTPTITITGNNTVGGDFSNVTSNLRRIQVSGNNVIGGDITLKSFTNLDNVNIAGNNVISGDLTSNNIGASQIFIITGNNTLSGRVEDFLTSTTLLSITIEGNNVISGNFDLVDPLVNCSITLRGANTAIATFENIKKIRRYNGLTSTNSLAGIQGNIAAIDLNAMDINGTTDNLPFFNSTLVRGPLSYTNKDWSMTDVNDVNTFFLGLNVNNPSFLLTAAELDQLLIDLNNSTFRKAPIQFKTDATLNLNGGFTRTSASDTAFNQLIADGMNITIN